LIMKTEFTPAMKLEQDAVTKKMYEILVDGANDGYLQRLRLCRIIANLTGKSSELYMKFNGAFYWVTICYVVYNYQKKIHTAEETVEYMGIFIKNCC